MDGVGKRRDGQDRLIWSLVESIGDSIDKLLDTLDIQYIEREEQEEPVGGYFSGKNIVLTGKMREVEGWLNSRLGTLGARF